MFNGKQYWMCEKRGFTKVYGRVGDEDLVGNVLRLSGRQRLASEGIRAGQSPIPSEQGAKGRIKGDHNLTPSEPPGGMRLPAILSKA